MNTLDLQRFDASYNFKVAFDKNVEANGLENVIIQFKALANIYAPDFYIDVTTQNVHDTTETN